ncbi:MAG: 7TM diverse intracellular signaling domain-containing protein [Desulfobacter sp.]
MAENGVLDLSQWNFSKDGPVAMRGHWDFFWQRHIFPAPEHPPSSRDGLIRVPGAWNRFKRDGSPIPGRGFATFRLQILLAASHHYMGLKFLDMSTAFAAYINGEKIYTSGIPGTASAETVPGYAPKVVPIPEASTENALELVIHVSNFHHWQGGMWETVTIGNVSDLNAVRNNQMFLDALLFGSILVMGIYHLFLYRFRPGDKSALFFGLFCLITSIRPITHGERLIFQLFPDAIPFTLFMQINYISFYLCAPLFAHYARCLFPGHVPGILTRGTAAAGVLAAATALVLPPQRFTAVLPWFQGVVLIAVAYGCVCLVKAVRDKAENSGVFTLGFLILGATILNDILYSRQIIDSFYTFPFGLFSFILCQAVLLSRRFARAFDLITFQQKTLESEMIRRKQIETDLVESEFRFRQMADFLPVPLCETDIDLNIVYANRAALVWLQYTEVEMSTGLPLSRLLPESDIRYFNPLGRQVLGHQEISLVRKDGKRLWAMVETARIRVKNEILGLRICFVDLSERKKAEKALLHAAEQEKYALVGQVAGKMAHDFNNILSAIMGNTELALMDCQAPGPRKHLDIIFDQTKRGHMLTQNLVAFARDQDPKAQCVALPATIDRVVNLMDKELSGIRVSRTYDNTRPDILADPGMIEQTIVNLIQNAAHALSLTPLPGIDIRTMAAGERTEIVISDNGCGIPEKFHQDIYTPSFTLKGSKDTTGAYAAGIKGTGYGLANVRKYVDKHGGNIRLTSRPGKGTSFVLSLPAGETPCSTPPATRAGNGEITGKHILVVEDEAAISAVFEQILTHPPFEGTTAVVAENGKDAKKEFTAGKFDLVSLDYMLPGKINGLDVYHFIRETDKEIPIVFVSGNMEFIASIQHLLRNDPCLGHLPKPCDNATYANAIGHWLSGNPQ